MIWERGTLFLGEVTEQRNGAIILRPRAEPRSRSGGRISLSSSILHLFFVHTVYNGEKLRLVDYYLEGVATNLFYPSFKNDKVGVKNEIFWNMWESTLLNHFFQRDFLKTVKEINALATGTVVVRSKRWVNWIIESCKVARLNSEGCILAQFFTSRQRCGDKKLLTFCVLF